MSDGPAHALRVVADTTVPNAFDPTSAFAPDGTVLPVSAFCLEPPEPYPAVADSPNPEDYALYDHAFSRRLVIIPCRADLCYATMPSSALPPANTVVESGQVLLAAMLCDTQYDGRAVLLDATAAAANAARRRRVSSDTLVLTESHLHELRAMLSGDPLAARSYNNPNRYWLACQLFAHVASSQRGRAWLLKYAPDVSDRFIECVNAYQSYFSYEILKRMKQLAGAAPRAGGANAASSRAVVLSGRHARCDACSDAASDANGGCCCPRRRVQRRHGLHAMATDDAADDLASSASAWASRPTSSPPSSRSARANSRRSARRA